MKVKLALPCRTLYKDLLKVSAGIRLAQMFDRDRQTDRQTDRDGRGQTETGRDRQRQTQTDKQMYRQMYKHVQILFCVFVWIHLSTCRHRQGDRESPWYLY